MCLIEVQCALSVLLPIASPTTRDLLNPAPKPPTPCTCPPLQCFLHLDGRPSWGLLLALRTAAATPAERKSCSHLLAAGQRASVAGDVQVRGLFCTIPCLYRSFVPPFPVLLGHACAEQAPCSSLDTFL